MNRENFFEINWRAFLDGFGASVSKKILHDSGKTSIAENKILQLQAASKIGLAAPKTLFSNSVNQIVDFIKENK